MARPGRPGRNTEARSFRQLRRFRHVINTDRVFGTHRVRWQFGEEMKNGFPVHMVGSERVYRGRVKFLSEDDMAQYCYFVAHSHKDMSIMPDVLGEHMFSHLWEWEGKAAPNGNAASLFIPA